MLTPLQRRRFDTLLEGLIDQLPDNVRDVLEEVPLIVEDEPGEELLGSMKIDARTTDLCGLHWGVALTHRSIDMLPRVPDRMMLFRGPIMRVAGRRLSELEAQIRITLLHEIGHHFGLGEDELRELQGMGDCVAAGAMLSSS